MARLIDALLLEQNAEWAVQYARYITLEAIAPLGDDLTVSRPRCSLIVQPTMLILPLPTPWFEATLGRIFTVLFSARPAFQLIAFVACLGWLNWAEPAMARTAGGWSAFKIWRVYDGHSVAEALSCVYESYGAVVNGCSYNVGLTFDMSIDNNSNYVSATVDMAATSSDIPITCVLNAFQQPGSASGWSSSAPVVLYIGHPGQLTVSTPYLLYTIGLYCDNIAPGAGIGVIQWNQ